MPFPKNAHRFSPSVKPPCKEDVLTQLKAGPQTVKQLAAKVGVNPDAVSRNLRNSHRRAYICDYTETGAPIWTLGDQPHAIRAPQKKTEQNRRYRAKRARSDVSYLNDNYIKGERIQWGGMSL